MPPPFASLAIVPLWAGGIPLLAYAGVALSGRILRIERRWAAALGTALFATSLAAPVLCCLAPRWVFGPPRPGPGTAAVGMAAAEVETILGKPDARFANPGRETWEYNLTVLAVPLESYRVIFGPDGRVTGTYHPD